MDQPSTSNGNVDSVTNVCQICFLNTDEKLVNVTEKGKETLRKSSIERGDKLFEKLDFSKIVRVHATCRRDYTHTINIQVAKRKNEDQKASNISPVKRKLRRSSESSTYDSSSNSTVTEAFNWKDNCLFCEEEVNSEKDRKINVSRRKKVTQIDSSDFVLHLVNKLTPLKDDYHRAILQRITGENRDLVNLQAKYHRECYLSLKNQLTLEQVALRHPKDKYSAKIDEAMEKIYSFMLSSEECQFTITQLKNIAQVDGVILDEKTVKNRLKKKFSDQVVFSSRMGGVTYVCFSNNLYDILTDTWRSRNIARTIEEEENNLIDSAAELIRREIRTTICNLNEYPASDQTLNNVNENIPPQLIRFLNHVIYKDKEQNDANEKWFSRRITSIAHAIVAAARPKSFLSPLQLTVGATLYRKFGSKRMMDISYQLGFSCSYAEIKRYEVCAALQGNRSLEKPFLQIVADNCDCNIGTIDGRNTFHFLGSIEIITPADCLKKRLPISRLPLSEIPKATELVENNKIHVSLYTQKPGSGLKEIKVTDFENVPSFQETLIDKLNILWMYLKYVRDNDFIGWNGFMTLITGSRTDYAVSLVNFLPFVNAAPSDYSTLYTILKCASEMASKEGMKTCIITFDQPLYIKARDIIAAMNFLDIMMVVRLGGFHLVMSFMGCIGYIMAASGIKEIFSLIYAEGSVDKMLDGHSYARAVRAHFILQQALSILIIEELKNENAEFQGLLADEDIFSFDMDIDKIQSNENFEKLHTLFEKKLVEIEKRGKTCQLWVQYFKMVSLLKNILAAERMGDWNSHLQSVELTIPFFHAAGHFNYAKSARLYVQDMKNLETTMDVHEYHKFTDGGFFTSRRTNAYYSGIFSDQTIEQTLMRSMSVEGGPFKRGATSSVVFKWIKGIIFTKDMIEDLEQFCNVEFSKSHQHVDAREARVQKDKKDVLTIKQFLQEDNPFEDIEHLQNIATGLIGTDEINCYDALRIGIEAMKKITGVSFADIKLSKKDKVIPLIGVNSKLKIGDSFVPVDPLLLFQRISVMKKSDEELSSYLKFELAPYPLTLFDEIGMRKSNKSVLYSAFQSFDVVLNKESCKYYIDGGMLLYKVKWPTDCKYEKVFQEYVAYLKRHFGDHITVIFDSYDESDNKDSERSRRSLKVASREFNFTKDSKLTIKQEKFLSNYKNKNRLITYLMQEFQTNSIKCYQEKGEADVLIVETAVEDDTDFKKVIVAEDIDILVILTARAKVEEEIYYLKMGKQNSPSLIYSSKSLEVEYPNSADLILFAHSFSGCDSTSAFFNKGKKKLSMY